MFTIPREWNVFLLEDDAKRISWFKKRVANLVLATNAEDGLRILSERSFEAAFLDHDLTFDDAAFPDARPGSGVRVAHFLEKKGFEGLVVIHSVNECGAGKMKSYLPSAHLAPFGTFDVKCD